MQERAGYGRKTREKGFPLPGGEGRVRGLFLDVARRLNNKAKLVPEKCGDFGRSKCRKSRRIIHSAIHLSRNPPTDSFEEAISIGA